MATEPNLSFGYWVRRRRKMLDLTQQELARRSHCALATIKKIEADERRPCLELAGLLAETLGVAGDERRLFLQSARGLRSAGELTIGGGVAQGSESSPAPLIQWPAASIAPATTFFGRSRELTQLAELLRNPQARLISLVGPGGVGKTRLALTCAHQHASEFAGGAAVIALGEVTDPREIAQAVARGLGLTFVAPQPIEQEVLRVLSDQELLLVLDNFEHVMAGASFVVTLLAKAPHIKLLIYDT